MNLQRAYNANVSYAETVTATSRAFRFNDLIRARVHAVVQNRDYRELHVVIEIPIRANAHL
jgi:hypothetical protein